jgi:hypothetical protein
LAAVKRFSLAKKDFTLSLDQNLREIRSGAVLALSRYDSSHSGTTYVFWYDNVAPFFGK